MKKQYLEPSTQEVRIKAYEPLMAASALSLSSDEIDYGGNASDNDITSSDCKRQIEWDEWETWNNWDE